MASPPAGAILELGRAEIEEPTGRLAAGRRLSLAGESCTGEMVKPAAVPRVAMQSAAAVRDLKSISIVLLLGGQ